MPENTPLPQDGIDRTPTGEIKDQSQLGKTESTDLTKKEEVTTEKETKSSDKKDESSLLNQKEGDKDGKEEKPAGAPEKYETFKAPEGFVITEEAHKEVGTLFKEMNLSQEQGQKLVDFIAPQILKAVEAPAEFYMEMRQGWQEEAKQKYGSKLGEVKTTVSKAIDSLGDAKLASSFREAMDLTGAGDHPAFIDTFYQLAKRVTEGTAVKGTGPSAHGQSKTGGAAQSAAARVYPHLPSAG